MDTAGRPIRSDAEAANLFAGQFSSVYVNEPSHDSIEIPLLGARPKPRSIFAFMNFDELTVGRFLSRLPTKNNVTPDGIPSILLKRCYLTLSLPLCIVFNRCLHDGSVPSLFKHAAVVPVPKKPPPTIDNLWPVCVTSVVARTMQRCVRNQLMAFLDSNDLLTDHQFGFRPSRSVGDLLSICLDDWTAAVEAGSLVDVVLFDLKSALDKVNHTRLLCKLKRSGIDGYLLHWLERFIRGRTCQACVGSSTSQVFHPQSGVAQGSVLAPLLFLISISDTAEYIPDSVKLYAYADDIRVYRRVRKGSPDPCSTIQEAINGVLRYSEVNGLPLSKGKSVLLCIGDTRSKRSCRIGEDLLYPSESARDLGLIVRNDLRTTDHVKKVSKAATVRLFLLLKALRTSKTELLLRGYTSYVRPMVESFTVAYNPVSRQETEQLERVHRQFTRAVFRRPVHSRTSEITDIPPYAERYRLLKLDTLEWRRQKFDLSAAYRHIHRLTPFEDSALLQNRPRSTRLGPCLQKPMGRTRIRRSCFRYRTTCLVNVSFPLTHFLVAKSFSACKTLLASYDSSTVPSYADLV